MKRLFVVLAALVAATAVAVPMSLAANDYNATAALVHVGPNVADCSYGSPAAAYPGPDSGVVNVHYNVAQDRFMVNLSVHDALPNTKYVLDIRCWTFGPQSELGALTTDSLGSGTAHFTLDLNGKKPANPFYIDISVKGGGGGAYGYGDTFIAGPFTLGTAEIVPVPLLHGILPVLGFRIGPFAYLTDCNRIPDASWPVLDGVTTIVIDALRRRPHSTHFSVDEAVAVASRLGVERAYFTHVTHDLGHAETCARLPRGMELAYDGLVIDI